MHKLQDDLTRRDAKVRRLTDKLVRAKERVAKLSQAARDAKAREEDTKLQADAIADQVGHLLPLVLQHARPHLRAPIPGVHLTGMLLRVRSCVASDGAATSCADRQVKDHSRAAAPDCEPGSEQVQGRVRGQRCRSAEA